MFHHFITFPLGSSFFSLFIWQCFFLLQICLLLNYNPRALSTSPYFVEVKSDKGLNNWTVFEFVRWQVKNTDGVCQLVQRAAESWTFIIVHFACSLGSVVGVCQVLLGQMVKDLCDRFRDFVSLKNGNGELGRRCGMREIWGKGMKAKDIFSLIYPLGKHSLTY